MVEWPWLERLSLDDVEAAYFAALFAHIQMPVTARLSVSLMVDDGDKIVDLVMAPLSRHFALPDSKKIRGPPWRSLCVEVFLDLDSCNVVKFHAGHTEVTEVSEWDFGYPFSLALSIDDLNIAAFLEWMLAELPLASVDTVVLDIELFLHTPEDLRYLFNPSFHIKTLVLFGDTFVKLCEMFKGHWEVVRLLRRMPYLARLVLRRCPVHEAFRANASCRGYGDEEHERLSLAGFDNQRALAIEIVECEVDDAHVHELWRAAGSDGEWDASWDKQITYLPEIVSRHKRKEAEGGGGRAIQYDFASAPK